MTERTAGEKNVWQMALSPRRRTERGNAPKSRLWGGDLPRGGKPGALGHAGRGKTGFSPARA